MYSRLYTCTHTSSSAGFLLLRIPSCTILSTATSTSLLPTRIVGALGVLSACNLNVYIRNKHICLDTSINIVYTSNTRRNSISIYCALMSQIFEYRNRSTWYTLGKGCMLAFYCNRSYRLSELSEDLSILALQHPPPWQRIS
jgi:hypothetical protein